MNTLDKYKQIIAYLIFGIATTIINITTYSFLVKYCLIDYKTSTIFAWLIAVLFAFITNKKWVFKNRKTDVLTTGKELLLFLLSRIFSLLLDLGSIIIFIEIFKINAILAKVLSNIIVIIANYFISKIFIFKNTTKL